MADQERDPMDVAIGAQIRSLRKSVGIGPAKLAEEIGVSPQQLQKYEEGSNRITANRLFAIAGVLDVPINRLFKPNNLGSDQGSDRGSNGFFDTDVGIRMARDLQGLTPEHQKVVAKLVQFLKEAEGTHSER